jgi:Cu/Ag efflux pump CusA
MLTTLTTFLGLAPMMLERSLQARFLIPMAVSLAFGVMFATLITLFLVPSLYMILEDIKTRVLDNPPSNATACAAPQEQPQNAKSTRPN